MTGTLTTVLTATGPNGATTSREHREPLTETNLLRAGLALITQQPDDTGWTTITLRAAL